MKALPIIAAFSFTLLAGCGPISEAYEETKKEAKAASKSLLEESTGINVDELLEAKKELGVNSIEEGKQAALEHIDGVVEQTIGEPLAAVQDINAEDLEQQVNDVIKQKKTELAQWLLEDANEEE
ncbi:MULTISPECIES: hypothetical protein [Motilimonas]|uniref:Lipoprotein n=1 Tax=Motilimonas cestriensis TaxID=2742685 RepID=A0ABS8W858_9GAMM|nr:MULTISPECIES: hypothetical protein [Motilimonas]MCE0557341.1 hypothetical protein [Motilimonas sp. E26]MCE2594733.1 hypothetical protein [Motilimonas cestriensis]